MEAANVESPGLHHHRRYSRSGYDDGETLPLPHFPGAADHLIVPNVCRYHQRRKAMLDIMPGTSIRGEVGVVTGRDTGYEAAAQMNALGIGPNDQRSVSAAIRSTVARSFDHAQTVRGNPETEAVMMIGEIGVPQEAEPHCSSRRTCRKRSSDRGWTDGAEAGGWVMRAPSYPPSEIPRRRSGNHAHAG